MAYTFGIDGPSACNQDEESDDGYLCNGWRIAVGLGFFILYVALSGLIVGALARWALPRPDPMGCQPSIGYGLGGSFLGGIAGRLVHLPTWADLIASVAGAALLIWFFRRRQTAARPSQDQSK